MASPKGINAVPAASDLTFPAADVVGELNPGRNKSVEVDPISSQVATSLEIQEKAEAAQKEKERQTKKDAMETLKTAIIVSGVLMAVAGAIFVITKKLKEK